MDTALQQRLRSTSVTPSQLCRPTHAAPLPTGRGRCHRSWAPAASLRHGLHTSSPSPTLHRRPVAVTSVTREPRPGTTSGKGAATAVTAESAAAARLLDEPGAPDSSSPSSPSSPSSYFSSSSSSSNGGGVMENSSITSMDWNDWMMSSSSSSDGGEGLMVGGDGNGNARGGTFLGGNGGGKAEVAAGLTAAGGGDTSAAAAAAAAGVQSPAVVASAGGGGGCAITIRIAFYAVAASFDRRQLEGRLREVYGNQAVRKYPDVIHCQLSRGREAQPGTDVFFFDYGVVAAWGMSPDAERDLVQNIAVQCAVQPLPNRSQERDVFRCTFATNPLELEQQQQQQQQQQQEQQPQQAAARSPLPPPPPPPPVPEAAAAPPPPPAADALGSILDVEYGSGSSGSLGSVSGTISNRRYTRRAERSGGVVAAVAAAAAVVPPPPVPLVAPREEAPSVPLPPPPPPLSPPPAAIGPYSFLTFPPKISDDTVLLHVRHCGDTATLLAVSYALAQSTKLSAFEQAVENIVAETQGLPEALAEHGEVHLAGKEIGRLIGKVFVLKRSVNLLGSVAQTPEFFWYAPDQLQSLYMRITEYVELSERVEGLNGRFAVLQEMLELLRAQEEHRHGSRLELVVIWLIVVEVVLGVFELLELFGVIGPKHGF